MSAIATLLTHRELIENLVMRDIKSRYKQATLGIAWTILSPLLMSLIFSLVGKVFLRQDVGIPFPIYVYFGLLFWNLFSSGVMGATESLVAHLGLITKVYFPREVFPISTVAAKCVDFFFGLLGMIPLLIIYKVAPSPQVVLILPLLVVVVLFATGLGLLLSCANLFYRDFRYVVALVMNAWLYLVPNLYPLEMVPPRFQSLYLLNPMAALIHTARRLTFPQIEGPLYWRFVAVAAIVSALTFVLGYVVFKHYEPRFAESV